jgi:NADPH:quinone reductase-like Zn-dependent oxidoreductase
MMMRALVYDRYGRPETLQLEHVPQPQPGPGEVLVRVQAASLNSWDWDLMVGTPMGRVNGPFGPPRRILGADIAGTVEAVGPGVTGLAPGDRVFGDLSTGKWGGLAEFALARASALAMIPEGLSFIDAAALPQAGCLALQALRRRPQLGQGDGVLINGAGGGVGTFAVQLAKLAGAHVTAVDRAEKRDALIALGADNFIDYRQADYTAGPDQYDLIVDVVASRPIAHYARALAAGGTFVAIGGTFGTLIQAALFGRLTGRKRRLDVLVYRVLAEDSAELARHTLAGTIKPVIDGIYPLEQGAAALRRLGDGLAIGKVIVTPAA